MQDPKAIEVKKPANAKALMVTYQIRCYGCGSVLGSLTFPAGTPPPATLNTGYRCMKDCSQKGK
ncbi:MAG TPA: hypothetical protein VKW04_18215 [Planctomycetota bacterium]|nr:hypothetical protein [Planctomycetota bacterium]